MPAPWRPAPVSESHWRRTAKFTLCALANGFWRPTAAPPIGAPRRESGESTPLRSAATRGSRAGFVGGDRRAKGPPTSKEKPPPCPCASSVGPNHGRRNAVEPLKVPLLYRNGHPSAPPPSSTQALVRGAVALMAAGASGALSTAIRELTKRQPSSGQANDAPAFPSSLPASLEHHSTPGVMRSLPEAPVASLQTSIIPWPRSSGWS